MYCIENINDSKIHTTKKSILIKTPKESHWYSYWEHIDFLNSFVYYKKNKRTIVSKLVLYKSNIKIRGYKNIYFIRNVGVHRKYRGKGECKKIIQYLFKNLPCKGKSILFIEVANGNIPAYKCYKKFFIKSKRFIQKMKKFNEKEWKALEKEHKYFLQYNPRLLFQKYQEEPYNFIKNEAKMLLFEKKI